MLSKHLLALAAASTTLAAQGVIDFETIPGSAPSDGLTISSQFAASLGVSFSLQGGGHPVLAQVGDPRTAFQGYQLRGDQPAPGVNAGMFFLTDDGVVGQAMALSPTSSARTPLR